MIANADVAFLDHLDTEAARIEDGGGVTRDAWLQALAEQPPLEAPEEETRAVLSGRALDIAAAMDCPCGCESKVTPCGCRTAQRIEHELAEMPLDGLTDVEVIERLNRKFCVGAQDPVGETEEAAR